MRRSGKQSMAFAAWAFFAATVQADVTFEPEGNGGWMTGHTTFQVGYPVTCDGVKEEGYFPFSELKFPLDVTVAGVRASWRLGRVFEIGAAWQGNLTEDAGEMEDSDWLTPSNPDQQDIFSTSDSELSAVIMDARLGWRVPLKAVSLSWGAGYRYQKFDYDCRLIRQWSPSGLSGYDYEGDGTVGLTYRIDYNIPYLYAGVGLQPARKVFLAGTLAGGIVAAEDDDHHLLREPPITSRGSYTGAGIMATLEARFQPAARFFFGLRGNVLSLTATGEQDNSTDPSDRWTTRAEVSSLQTQTLLFAGFVL